MRIFGLQIETEKGMAKIKQNMRYQAIGEVVEFLKGKENIILEPGMLSEKTITAPLTIVGNDQVVAYCHFSGISGDAITSV